MSSSHKKPKRVPRIGSLLVESGLISAEPLEEAARVARESNQPIGRVLLMLEYLSDRDLKSALLSQSLIAHGLVSQDTAIEALKTASLRRISLDDALNEMGVTPAMAPERHALGELLLAAGFLTRQLYDEALRARQESGVLFGRFLVLHGAITNAMLGLALEVLVLIREGRLTRQEAVAALTEMRSKRVGLSEALATLGIFVGPLKRTKLGDILASGGLITDSESLDAVELGLEEKRLFGQILTQSGMIDKTSLEAALSLQEMVLKGLLDKAQASEVLRQVSKDGTSIMQVAQELKFFDADPEQAAAIINLLTNAGLIDDHSVQKALARNQEFKGDPVKALLADGIIDRELYGSTLELLQRLEGQELKIEQCIILLQWCQRSRCSIDEAMQELNMKGVGEQPVQTEMPPAQSLPSRQAIVFDRLCQGLDLREVKQLVKIGLLFAACGWAVIAIVPKDYQIYLLWTLVVFLSLTLMGLGRAWGTGRQAEQEALQMRIQGVRAPARKKLPSKGAGKDSQL